MSNKMAKIHTLQQLNIKKKLNKKNRDRTGYGECHDGSQMGEQMC